MPEKKLTCDIPIEAGAVKLQFRDLAKEVMATWQRSGYARHDLEDAFGSGDWAGLPDEDEFRELAEDVVEHQLKDQPNTELRRLMRSRLYNLHQNIDLHSKFQFFDEEYDNNKPSRSDLLAAAVWEYLTWYLADQWNKRIVDEPTGAEDTQCSLAL